MTRNEILIGVKKYFKISELVCSHVSAKWGESAWQFLQTDYLHALLIIRRDILMTGMTCNTGSLFQRGMRCNMCDLVKTKTTAYLSSHILGQAGDFTVTGMTAAEARTKIKNSANLLPCNVRLEADVTWLHFDTLNQTGITAKVYEFKV